MTFYLFVNGTSDKLVTPSLTYNEIVIDFTRLSSSSGALQYLVDGRQSNINNVYLYSSGDSGPEYFGGALNVYKDGTSVTSGTEIMMPEDRIILRFVTATQTAQLYFFARNTSIQFSKTNVFNIKLYNNGTLIAHYDMTLGNVQDQSGNGNHAILTGGTWIENVTSGTIVTGDASISASGNTSANGSLIASGSSNISADGSITGNGLIILNGQASISASSSITADGETSTITRLVEGEASLSADSSLSGEATLLINGVGNISASSSLIASGILVINGAASISAGSQVVAEAMVYDPTKMIMNKIKLNGQRDYTSKLEGNQESKVSLIGSRDYTIKLEGGIMATVRQNFNMYAEDSKEIVVTVKKEDGTALVLTGATVKWGFDNVVKTTTSGITITNAASGEFTVKLNPIDTQNKNGVFSHGGTVTDAAGNVSTVIVGEMTINKKVV